MILQMAMPAVNPSLRAGRVVAWHKHVGDRVGYGDALCDVLFEQATHLKRTTRAAELADGVQQPRGRRRYRTLTKIEVVVRLVASDAGYLRRVFGGDSDQHEAGSILALLSTDPTDALPEASEDGRWPQFRVVANQLEEEPGLEDEGLDDEGLEEEQGDERI